MKRRAAQSVDKPLAVRRFRTRRSGWANVALHADKTVLFRGRKKYSTTPYFGAVESTEIARARDNCRAAFDAKCTALLKGAFVEILPARKRRNESNLSRLWREVEEWCYQHVPASFAWPLSVRATREEIEQTERLLGRRLPADVRKSYLKYNGSNGMGLFGVISEGEWAPLKQVAREWQLFASSKFDEYERHPVGPMKPVAWSGGWIPISDASSGDFLCVDLDPPKEGRRGQLFSYWHEYDGAWRFVASSFEDYLGKLVWHLKKGHYQWRETGDLWPATGESEVGKMIDLFQSAPSG